MKIPLPTNVELREQKKNRAEIVIEPCYPGYGVTLGNALRRTLLSSIGGAAITSFRFKGIQHEFSTLPNVKEDMVELMLNLKKVRAKCFSDEPVVVSLKAKGIKEVKTGDFEKNAQVEFISQDLTIFNTTDAKAEVEMEVIVQKGMGYVTVEEREKEKVDIGTIMIDAIYSPLVNVGFEVESVRVGQKTNFDRLVIKIETDGTITPKEAMEKASGILVEHFSLLGGLEANSGKKHEAPEAKEEKSSLPEESNQGDEVNSEEESEEDKPKKKRGRPKKNS